MIRGTARRLLFVVVAIVLLMAAGASASEGETESTDEPNLVGAQVYTTVCAACHQADGRGLSGAFPPLVDNPNVSDADYLASVIVGGREGEITVGGETYNGVMPAFSTLSDDEVAAVVAYVQEDLGQPSAAPLPTTESAGDVAGTALPSGAALAWRIGIWLGIAGFLAVAVPVVLARREGDTITWGSAWLKTSLILVFFAAATVFLPSALIESSLLRGTSRIVQDLVASGVWALALGIGVVGLWWAQRDRRI